jgi:hypothetical protein
VIVHRLARDLAGRRRGRLGPDAPDPPGDPWRLVMGTTALTLLDTVTSHSLARE